ncbi:MAG: hypothetical protein NT079_04645 [Candidatus Omnitrophica bacterium]|nr:hypothetical protein [Candidatus Omnitrophota bacterium]
MKDKIKKILLAQSTLEFMMIIILVIAGVVVMGPYVIRSVNAYMRSWEIAADQARFNPNVPLHDACNGVCDFGDTITCPQDCQ